MVIGRPHLMILCECPSEHMFYLSQILEELDTCTGYFFSEKQAEVQKH